MCTLGLLLLLLLIKCNMYLFGRRMNITIISPLSFDTTAVPYIKIKGE